MTTPTATQTKAEYTDSLILRELANGPRSVTDLCIAINHTDKSDSKRVDNRLQDLKQRHSVGIFGKRWHLLNSDGKPVHPPDATIPGAMRVTRVPVVGAAKAAAPSNGTRGVPSGTPIVPPAPPPPPTKSPDVSERERAEAATRLENAEARKYLRGGLVAVLEALGRRPTRELLDDELVDQAKRAAAERNVALASAESAMQLLRDIAREVGDDEADNHTGPALASRVVTAIQDLRQEGDEADRLLKQRAAEARTLAEETQARVEAAWRDTAEMHARNETWLRSLLVETAQHLGPEVFTQDDGGVVDEPLVSKVPLLVARLADVRTEASQLRSRCAAYEAALGEDHADTVRDRDEARQALANAVEVLDYLGDQIPQNVFDEIASALDSDPGDLRAQLAAVYRQLGISDPPPTAEERDRVIAELRTAAVEASSLRAKLQTAQDVIKRLEADVQRAQAEAGSHPTEAPPWTPPDRVVGNLFSDIADGALSAIGAGEDQGAELAVLALRSLHEAQLNLQALRHRHDSMLGFEVSSG